MTFYGELVATQEDCNGYINYVFKVEECNLLKCKYITCVRYPNWECKYLTIGCKGYIQVETRKAGIDTWFDGSKLIPYNYDNVQFMKFIDKGISTIKTCVM